MSEASGSRPYSKGKPTKRRNDKKNKAPNPSKLKRLTDKQKVEFGSHCDFCPYTFISKQLLVQEGFISKEIEPANLVDNGCKTSVR